MVESTAENYQFNFNVGMTCDGCAGAIKRILDKEDTIVSFVTDVPNKTVTVIGPEGTDTIVLEKLTKWATAAKKTLEYVGRTDIVAAE